MSAPLVSNATLRVALAEYDTGWQQPESSLDRAAVCVQRAASTGARLVVLPEMCTTGFTMEPEHWS
jgi:predicted amidohydrolase